MLEWTGERYLPFIDPKISGAEIHYEHLHRYCFALQFVKGKEVLDLGCGEGYGSYILSKSAAHVVGVDIDEKTVKHASSKYIKNNLKFIQGSAIRVPIEGEKLFDVIVCFELLEHIEEHDELLSEIKRLLKDSGILIISTPNKRAYSDETNYKNPFHKKELYFDEFEGLLRKYFKYIHFFGQRVYAGSNLWSLVKTGKISEEHVVRKGKEFFIADHGAKEPIYFVAVASDREAKALISRSYLTDVDDAIFNNFRARLNSLEAERSSLSDQLERAREELDRTMAELAIIKDSFGYAFMRFYTRILHGLLPDGTRRGEWRKAVVASLRTTMRKGISLKRFQKEAGGSSV